MAASRTLLTFVLVFSGNLFLSLEEDYCEPEEMCWNSTAGTKVINPTNCTTYFLCVNGEDENGDEIVIPSDRPIECDNGASFCFNPTNFTESDCCEDEDDCDSWSHFNCLDSTRYCSTECTNDLDLLAFPNDCTKYYVCLPSFSKEEVDCPESSPYFDGETCQDDVTKCCDICTPYCEEENTVVVNPLDCTSYYHCDCSNCSPNSEPINCPDGQAFFPDFEDCKVDVFDCEPLCPSSMNHLNKNLYGK